MLHRASLLLILFVSLSLSSSKSIFRKSISRRQSDSQYCQVIEGFDCKCSRPNVTCTNDLDLSSPIKILTNEKNKYQLIELVITAPTNINVDDHTFEPIKELYKADGEYFEFRIKFEKFTGLHLTSPGLFNRVFPDNLPKNAIKRLALEIYNPDVQQDDNIHLFQNLHAHSLELYGLYPFRGTFQQLFDGANIKFLRLSGGDVRSDLSQPFTGTVSRLELARQASALSVQNFPPYPAHELTINAFYITDFNPEHVPNYDNLVELRVFSPQRIPSNAFRQYPNLRVLSVSSSQDIDPHALDGLNNLEKLTIKDTKATLELLNSVPNVKEFETNIEKLDEFTQCQFLEKLANGQIAVKAIPNGGECTCVIAYLDTAAGRFPCDAQDCGQSSCDAIKNNYDAATRTFKASPPIQRSDGTNVFIEREQRVYTTPFQVAHKDQEKLHRSIPQNEQQSSSEVNLQTSDTDEQNKEHIDQFDDVQDLFSSSKQHSCSIGKYLYQDECILCTPGYYCPDGKTRITCPEGKFTRRYGLSVCQECPEGWYSTCNTSERCLICPRGFYCPIKNQEPQSCPIGYYSRYGAIECTKCPSGYYTTYKNSSYCFQCPMGYSCEDPSQCPQPCPAGTYQSDIMSTSCKPCSHDHQCGNTTNLLKCTTTSCIQAEEWLCDQNQLGPPTSTCTKIN